jgi:hypothetical protein
MKKIIIDTHFKVIEQHFNIRRTEQEYIYTIWKTSEIAYEYDFTNYKDVFHNKTNVNPYCKDFYYVFGHTHKDIPIRIEIIELCFQNMGINTVPNN